MTFTELLETVGAEAKLPEVFHKELGVGRVTVIKDQADGSKFRGCAVRFPQLNYDTWFTDSKETDKRSKYLRDLWLR